MIIIMIRMLMRTTISKEDANSVSFKPTDVNSEGFRERSVNPRSWVLWVGVVYKIHPRHRQVTNMHRNLEAAASGEGKMGRTRRDHHFRKKRVAVDRTSQSQHTVDLSNPLLSDGDSIPNSFLLRLHSVIKESPKSNLKGCMLRRFKDRDGKAEETYLS